MNLAYHLPPLIAAGIAISLLVTLVLHKPKERAHWLFTLYLLDITIWALIIFAMRTSPDVERALLWDRAVVFFAFAAAVLIYHFSRVFTKIVRQGKLLPISYAILALVLVLSPTALFIRRMDVQYYGYAPIVGPAMLPIVAFGLMLGIVAICNILKAYRISREEEQKTRMLYIAIGMVVAVLGAIFVTLPTAYPTSIFGNIVFCLFTAVAIVRYHLLDIRVVVRKSLIYLLASAAVAIPYVIVLLSLNQIFRTQVESWWVHAFMILLLAVLLRPLYSRAQEFIDRLFFRDRYDYFRALERFSGDTQSVASLEKLGSTMVNLIRGALRISSTYLLLPSKSKRGLVLISSAGLDSPPSGVVLRDSSPLVKWLTINGDILSSEQFDVIPQLQSFSLKEKTELERTGAKLFVPIRTRDDRLSGILILGEKLSQQTYSVEDRRLLMAVSHQMAMAVDNARLYEETKESEEKLRLMYDSMTSGIAVLDLSGYVTQVNEAMLRIYDYDRKEEIIGRHSFELVASEDKIKAAENLERTLVNGNSTNLEFTLLRRGGSKFPAYVTNTVLKDALGNPLGFITVTEDITQRKEAEERERRLQQELNLAGRLASIGELAAGVAHEINNPLTGIMGFSERLLRKSTDEKSKRYLEIIYGEASRAAKVIENLRTFARRKEPKKELANINDILQKALEMRIYELRTSSIEVVANLTSGLPQILADFHQILQVFLNIIINAEQVMNETNRRGKLVVNSQEHQGYIRVTFTDEGPGIPRQNLDKIFDPFFTTRGGKGGTGLGLSICHGIVAEHGGKIYVRSKLGKGATFFVELPLRREV